MSNSRDKKRKEDVDNTMNLLDAGIEFAKEVGGQKVEEFIEDGKKKIGDILLDTKDNLIEKAKEKGKKAFRDYADGKKFTIDFTDLKEKEKTVVTMEKTKKKKK